MAGATDVWTFPLKDKTGDDYYPCEAVSGSVVVLVTAYESDGVITLTITS